MLRSKLVVNVRGGVRIFSYLHKKEVRLIRHTR